MRHQLLRHRLDRQQRRVRVQAGHADRHADPRLRAARQIEHGAGDAGADAFGHERGAVEVGIDQQHDEFLAAETAQRIRAAQFLADARCHFAQYFVAALVAMRVIDRFKMVDVDIHARNTIILAPRAGDFFQQAPVDIAAVIHARQGIGEADVFQHFIADHVFQADGDDGRHVLDEIRAQHGRKARHVATGQVQAADQALVAQQGHQGHAAQGHVDLRKTGAMHGRIELAQQGQGRQGRFALGHGQRWGKAQLRHFMHEQQLRKGAEIDAQLFHHEHDIVVLVQQAEGDAVEIGNDGQGAEDGADQFGKRGRADDFQVERLVAAHDVVVALDLFQQIGHARAQGLVFGFEAGNALGRRGGIAPRLARLWRYCLIHRNLKPFCAGAALKMPVRNRFPAPPRYARRRLR